MRLFTLLLILLALAPPAFAQSAIAQREGPRISIETSNMAGQLPPRNTAQRNQGGNNENNPEAKRQQLLQQLIIDRSPSGILQARVQATRPPEPEPEPEQPEIPVDPNAPEPTPEQLEAQRLQQEKQDELQRQLKAIQDGVTAFQTDITLGNWDQARAYLESLPDPQAQLAFARVLQQLGGPVTVQPLPELAAMGASANQQSQYLRPLEILSLSDAAKAAPDPDTLRQLATLVPKDNPPPASFFDLLKSGTRYFGTKDLETRLRTSEFLLNAGLLDQSADYLPDPAAAREANNIAALNLLARYHAEAHKSEHPADHLATAWALCTEIMGNPDAPLNERGTALYRALSLVPELEDGTGTTWLKKTFTSPRGEGFEILAAVGTLAAQSRQVQSDYFRLEQLKLQAAATKALLATKDADLSAWAETLTLYTLNWIHEADYSYQLDQNTSIRPNMQVDAYGNVFYSQERVTYQGRGVTPIPSADLVQCMPDDPWLKQVDESVRLDFLTRAARLYLKVKEENLAFPTLKRLAEARPEATKGLVSEMISVWAQNHNPNQQNRYRSSYYYFYGANQRAETIPLTRSKQERNLLELAKLVEQVRSLQLDETFDEEFSNAFIQAHSQAEVWRVEALESVFGDLTSLDPETLAALLRRMRTNLANLWPDPKIQQQAKTKRSDKELQQHVLKGYQAAKGIASNALQRHPGDWRMQIQLASLAYEEINYKSTINPNAKTSATKRHSLDALAAAAAAYTATLPLEKESDESTEPFETWLYAALGSPDLAALKAHHQPVTSEYPKIKAALAAIPEDCRDRHLERFATTINNRLANVSPDLKYRYLEAALQITGDHERVQSASDVFAYYHDLITEIELTATIDGPDQVSPDQPFGLFVNLRHTQEIERESGGFQRYLQNQNNSAFGYNYGRNTEDYRDKFEKAARNALEEHFEVQSITFHNDKIESRSDPEYGWRITRYAYLLLKPKGSEVDSIPPLGIDLDFLDTSGYVVLPVTSSALPIDASGKAAPRPLRDLAVTLTFDDRPVEGEPALHLDIKATALGLVPPLDDLLDTTLDGFTITDTEDRELLVEELTADTDDGAPRSVREWRLTLAATAPTTSLTFPAVQLPVKEEDGLLLQRYDDVDLLTVGPTIPLIAKVGPTIPRWALFLAVASALLVLLLIIFLLRRKAPEEIIDHGPAIPSTLTPVTLLSFLDRLKDRLPDDKRAELTAEIQSLQDHFFGPTKSPGTPDLLTLATHWQKTAS